MDFDVTIIGAGVVGLAIAAKLSAKYNSVLVIEKNSKFGEETSSRNSEVIHSGIYYPAGSLKTKLCVEGNNLLYQYCDEKNIGYRKCGKLIVANDETEAKQLSSLLLQAQQNGAMEGKLIGKNDIEKIQPNVDAVQALFFPSSGIIDSHGLMKQLESDCKVNGADFAYKAKVVGLNKINGGYKIFVNDADGGKFEFDSKVVINSAGLFAYDVSSLAGLNDLDYELHYWKGEYFSVGNGKNKLIGSLIYPVPNPNITGLGIHATVDLNNGLKLGPNSLYLENNIIDYSVDPEHKQSFFNSAKRFLPFLELEDLNPDQAGIRPKLQLPGQAFRDFIIANEVEKGYPDFINLIGIESPGLTACLAIAGYVENVILYN